MASTTPMRRLVCCVDGTYCTPNGMHKRGYGNISNTYRVRASIKQGVCQDSVTNKEVKQETIYKEGIGSADDINLYEKAKAGISGKGYKHMIREIYERCCMLDENVSLVLWVQQGCIHRSSRRWTTTLAKCPSLCWNSSVLGRIFESTQKVLQSRPACKLWTRSGRQEPPNPRSTMICCTRTVADHTEVSSFLFSED